MLQLWYRRIEAIENQTLRQRADDVLDLGRNIIRRLRGEQGAGFQAIPEGSILVAQHLLPSDVVLLPGLAWRPWSWKRRTGLACGAAGPRKGNPDHCGLSGHPVPHRQPYGTPGGRLPGHARSLRRERSAETEFQERITKWRAALVPLQAACHQPRHAGRAMDRRRGERRHCG